MSTHCSWYRSRHIPVRILEVVLIDLSIPIELIAWSMTPLEDAFCEAARAPAQQQRRMQAGFVRCVEQPHRG
jgi:hypothetical protein